jgi:hypothetical protein
MADAIYTEEQLQHRLKLAREAERYRVWGDVFRRFTSAQRRHIANLMAHDWTLSVVEIQSRYAGDPSRIDSGREFAAVLKELDDAKEKRRAERASAGVGASDHKTKGSAG